jgi:secreted trypsin-like serine protease
MRLLKIWAAATLPILCCAAMQPEPTEELPVPTEVEEGGESEEEDDGGRIVGGDDADEGTAPWQVEIYSTATYTRDDRLADAERERGADDKLYLSERKNFELRHKCGGSYIGGGWVITAAHCVLNQIDAKGGPANVLTDRRVRMGTRSLLAGETYAIERVVYHKGYKKALPKDDIALIKVREEGQTARLGAKLSSITLHKNADRPLFRNEPLRVTGWGWTGARKPGTAARLAVGNVTQHNPVILQQVGLNVVEDSVCANEPAFKAYYGPGTLCAGSKQPGKDSCKGDSGGPLTRQLPGGPRVLVGIVSQGVGCAYKGIPGVYTRVSAYEKWISDARKVTKKGVTPL